MIVKVSKKGKMNREERLWKSMVKREVRFPVS